MSAPMCELVLQVSPTSCSLQEEPMIQLSPSLAKGLQPPTGAWCHILGASSASTALWGWQWGRICCSAVSEAGAGCVPLGSLGKGCSGCSLTGSWSSNLTWSGGKSSQERFHKPRSACQRGGAPAARAVPLWMWLEERALHLGPCSPSLHPPLHTHLGLLALSEPAGFVVENALGQLEEPMQLPLFWAETAAQQFLFPFNLWQSP